MDLGGGMHSAAYLEVVAYSLARLAAPASSGWPIVVVVPQLVPPSLLVALPILPIRHSPHSTRSNCVPTPTIGLQSGLEERQPQRSTARRPQRVSTRIYMNPRGDSCHERTSSCRLFWCLYMDYTAQGSKAVEGWWRARVNSEPPQARLTYAGIRRIEDSAPWCVTSCAGSGFRRYIGRFEPTTCRHRWARRSTRRSCPWFDILVALKTLTSRARILGTRVEEARRHLRAAEPDRPICSPCRGST